MPKISNIAITSKFKLDQVESCDYLPAESEQRSKYKYYCPICLRYFCQILQSDCCMNYLCHFCAEDLKERENKVDQFKA
jgi:hypothetical protein